MTVYNHSTESDSKEEVLAADTDRSDVEDFEGMLAYCCLVHVPKPRPLRFLAAA